MWLSLSPALMEPRFLVGIFSNPKAGLCDWGHREVDELGIWERAVEVCKPREQETLAEARGLSSVDNIPRYLIVHFKRVQFIMSVKPQ